MLGVVVLTCAASSLLAGLLQGSQALAEVARTSSSVHYETGDDDIPVLCVALPHAIRLPNSVIAPRLPGPGAWVDEGVLRDRRSTWRIVRWWRPDRPLGLAPPSTPGTAVGGDLDPGALVGSGSGLTPEGDDVLAAALVTASATEDPRLPGWRELTRIALATRRTTAVSRGLLHHALDGYAVPQLADYLVTLCADGDLEVAERRLLEVGHSSGSALRAGVRYTLTTRPVAGPQRGVA